MKQIEKNLNINDFRVYKWLSYMKKNNIKMSMKEICNMLGFKSMTSLQRSLYKLEKLELVGRLKFQQFSWKVDKEVELICPCCKQIVKL